MKRIYNKRVSTLVTFEERERYQNYMESGDDRYSPYRNEVSKPRKPIKHSNTNVVKKEQKANLEIKTATLRQELLKQEHSDDIKVKIDLTIEKNLDNYQFQVGENLYSYLDNVYCIVCSIKYNSVKRLSKISVRLPSNAIKEITRANILSGYIIVPKM